MITVTKVLHQPWQQSGVSQGKEAFQTRCVMLRTVSPGEACMIAWPGSCMTMPQSGAKSSKLARRPPSTERSALSHGASAAADQRSTAQAPERLLLAERAQLFSQCCWLHWDVLAEAAAWQKASQSMVPPAFSRCCTNTSLLIVVAAAAATTAPRE